MAFLCVMFASDLSLACTFFLVKMEEEKKTSKILVLFERNFLRPPLKRLLAFYIESKNDIF